VDGELHELSEDFNLDKNKKHSIEIVVDRLVVREGIENRLADSMETALSWSDNNLVIVDVVEGEELTFSQEFACVDCGISIEELAPRMFSFNSPFGACPECNGLGVDMSFDPDLIIQDQSLTLDEGAVEPWNRGTYYPQLLEAVAAHFGQPTDVPVEELDPDFIDTILYGAGSERISFRYENRYGRVRHKTIQFEGVIPNLNRRYREASNSRKTDFEEYMSTSPCPACGGGRLRPEALAVTVGGLNIDEVTKLSVDRAYEFFSDLELTERQRLIGRQILKEIRQRLKFMVDVGLNYLTLARSAGSLSGGEAQRIRLATQIGSGLVGVMYILDEPSIGLHQRDNARLLRTLTHLRDQGNTVIIVEHDEETIRTADHIVDIGPGAGAHGGEIVATGSVEEIVACKESVTGQYLSGEKHIPVPRERRSGRGEVLAVQGARQHNLKDLDVDIPLGTLVCVTGVSGSGKSTLVNETLYRALAQRLHNAKARPGEYDELEVPDSVRRCIEIDQSPIGRTPRSNPATYTGVFDYIRETFAATPEAKLRGYEKGRFSFNLKGGRCEACSGHGINKVEMHFLPDVYVPCDVCGGRRYNRETLEVRYKGKNIADILDMTVEEALEFFRNIPKLRRKLQTLYDVGLGYIRLGQPSTELSGGEAQRVKLATELSRRRNGDAVYTLDEPTTGLHTADIHKLMAVLDRLVEAGDTVVVIEHNLDVIKMADYIIDLGPEGGRDGGRVIATGTPEEVALLEHSHTGRYLRPVLEEAGRLKTGVGAAVGSGGE
jgi:excinuclease ABC subunit A